MIQNNSLIVSLSVSQWTGRKLDRKITDEINTQHNASDDAGRYNKLLIAKEHTDPIQKVVSKARTFHYENTLCWGDNNERLLPAKNYFDYVNKINELKGDFDVVVSSFLKNYDHVINEARIRLNGMFRIEDYPNREEIESKFNFRTTFMPVPDTDFRVSLGNDEVEKLKLSVGQEINTRIAEAVKDTWSRVKDQLMKMKDRLSDTNSVFRDSLFENLNDLVCLLPKLNVTDDPNITKVCNEMVSRLAGVSPDAIRSNSNLRQQKANEVNDVLNKFGAFFS